MNRVYVLRGFKEVYKIEKRQVYNRSSLLKIKDPYQKQSIRPESGKSDEGTYNKSTSQFIKYLIIGSVITGGLYPLMLLTRGIKREITHVEPPATHYTDPRPKQSVYKVPIGQEPETPRGEHKGDRIPGGGGGKLYEAPEFPGPAHHDPNAHVSENDPIEILDTGIILPIFKSENPKDEE